MLIVFKMFVEALVAFLSIFLVVYLYFQWTYTYWNRRKVPFLEPSFPAGNIDSLLPRGIAMGLQSKKFYDHFKSMGVRYGGVYALVQPMLVLMDLDLIKDVLIKDFQFFADRGIYHNEESDKLSSTLFSQDAEKWKKLRIKFTPTFTSGKIKTMSKTVANVAQNMTNYIEEHTKENNQLDVKDLAQGFTIDVIGNTVFGIQCNSLKNPKSEFKRMAFRVFNVGTWLAAQMCLAIYWPNLGKKLGAKITNNDVIEFFTNVIEENVNYREQNKVVKQDFFQSLLDLKNLDKPEEKITMDEVSAQAFLFFVAGFETSSSTIMYCLFELAKDQELQEKARQDILRELEKNKGELDYDTIKEMKYLGQCVDETLRKYPLVPTLTRRATRDYPIKNSNVVIEKGTMILIPAFSIHRDHQIWPNPNHFDPERFSDENKKKIPPGAYLPFGDGPRNCIGMRFGLMQVKIGLSVLLKNYRFKLDPKTEDPIQFNPDSFVLMNITSIILNVEKIK